MLRPMAIAQTRETNTSRRFAALAAAGAIELGLIAMLMTGVASHVVTAVKQELTVVDLTPTPPPPQEIAPVKPEMVKPEVPTVPVPIIRIANPAPQPTITAVATPNPVVSTPAPTTPAPVATVPEPAPIAPTAVQSIMSTHTTPPYPEMARRLGESGQVQLHIAVAADGTVTNVVVTKSSGSERLDEAARAWVMSNWRYKAATQNGSGIAAETDALVVFDLKHSR
ncbi:MAG TPA: energy transducer TonB [Rhizomicrobium sp.]|jgi:protein TonB|nr:energy transducer TonB [Rhizomicrobium sp.]